MYLPYKKVAYQWKIILAYQLSGCNGWRKKDDHEYFSMLKITVLRWSQYDIKCQYICDKLRILFLLLLLLINYLKMNYYFICHTGIIPKRRLPWNRRCLAPRFSYVLQSSSLWYLLKVRYYLFAKFRTAVINNQHCMDLFIYFLPK